MNFALTVGAGLAVLAAVAFLLLFRSVRSRAEAAQTDLGWSSEFSIAKYRPMERLFLEEDYDFLAAQPGFHPKIYGKLQAERRRVFRHYLRCLRKDFNRLSTAAKTLVLMAPQDRPDLARNILKQRLMFSWALCGVEVRLALQSFGLGTVDVRGLVGAMESMREQLRYLSQNVQTEGASI
ncbi:MAG TPA: hypothetical protein VN893_24570 [Bryobacteraceae bacterium]|jgi:hypothetical protein|nr:hypothetical protein [Bryobacteraceae bacterium]